MLCRYYESEKYGDSLLQYSRIYGYYDLLLVSREGRVVYSSRKESELGRDIRNEDLGLQGSGLFSAKGSSPSISRILKLMLLHRAVISPLSVILSWKKAEKPLGW